MLYVFAWFSWLAFVKVFFYLCAFIFALCYYQIVLFIILCAKFFWIVCFLWYSFF
eukprot:GDKH01021367.1.p1 GENE.GDKH01021367.1~~GDKH01021367.1.p1  ORF type:complete len:55 (+),score=0.07 GDKH01021367.1:60-224(+)